MRFNLLRTFPIAALFLACASSKPPAQRALIGEPADRADARESSVPVVCLMYHRFATAEEFAKLKGEERWYCISIDKFEAQLRRLRELGYQSLQTADVFEIALGKKRPTIPSVLITIDDGCRSFGKLAEPVLRRNGFKATVFVTTGVVAPVFSGTKPHDPRMSDTELCSLEPSVIEIGSHGVMHRRLPELNDDELADELKLSRSYLERTIDRPVTAVSVPHGKFDDRVKSAARAAGYFAMFTSRRGPVQQETDPMALPRCSIAGHWSMRKFEEVLRTGGLRQGVETSQSASTGRLLPKQGQK